MRKIGAAVISICLALSGFSLSPAHASLPANGKYDCNTGLRTSDTPNFTVSVGVVSQGEGCIGAVVLPSGVTTVGLHAFFEAQQLESIYIPASVTSIEYHAFNSASSLTTVTFAPGSKLESIGGNAFENTAIRSISIPANVSEIGQGAFFGAGSLESVTIPAQVTYLQSEIFRQASSLHTVSFAPGSMLESIGDSAFKGATALTNITLPSGLSRIGVEAFMDTDSLDSLAFPKNLTEIGDSAFAGSALVSITLPAKLESIGYSAFFSSENLHSVYLLGKPVIGDEAFSQTASSAEILTSPPNPVLTNYVFNGWSASYGGAEISFPYRPNLSSAIVLYAKWIRINAKASASVKPSVTGTAKVSKTLTAKKGTWTGYPTPTVSYQWYACSSSISTPRSAVPTTCRKITGATKGTFKIASAQKGKFISVLVTGSSAGTTKTIWLTKSTSKVS